MARTDVSRRGPSTHGAGGVPDRQPRGYPRRSGPPRSPPDQGCFGNLAEALAPYGIGPDPIPTAFNVFMNVTVDPAGALRVEPPLSKAGDHILFEAEQDLIVALTACSALQSNNFAFKPIHYAIEGN